MKYFLTKYYSNIRKKPLGEILGVATPKTLLYSIADSIEYEGMIWQFGFIFDQNGEWHEGYVAISNGQNVYLEEFVPHIQIPFPFKSNVYLTQLFGENPKTYAKFGLKGHNGVDLVGIDKNIYSIGYGQATKDYDHNGYGNYVKVVGPTLTTIYAHLSSIVIENNSIVQQGQLIGVEGSTGNSTGSHLHIDIRLNSADNNDNGFKGRVDPLVYFESWGKIVFPDYVKGMNNYDK